MKTLLLVLLPISINTYAVTVDEVRYELIEQNVRFPLIVLSQSILECGWNYESRNARENKNLFGLYNSNNNDYFSFDTWQESVTGYKDMIQYRYIKGEGYYHFLQRIGYASDKDYIWKLKSIVKKLKND